MRAYFKTRPDLAISIAFHLFVFFGLLLFFFIKSCSKEKSVYVFEMIETSEQSPVIAQAELQPKSQPPILEKKEAEAIPIRRMNYEQFLKENAKPKPQATVPKTQTQVKPLPKFQVQPDQQAEVKLSQPFKPSATQKYGQDVFRQISAQWNKPSANSVKNLSVKVQFVVLSNGRIQSVKILEPSGNANFDQSILNVFKAIAQFKPTPSGQKETFVMNFKLKD